MQRRTPNRADYANMRKIIDNFIERNPSKAWEGFRIAELQQYSIDNFQRDYSPHAFSKCLVKKGYRKERKDTTYVLWFPDEDVLDKCIQIYSIYRPA